MKPFQPTRFLYLLFVAAVSVTVVGLTKSLFFATMLCGFEMTDHIVPFLLRSSKRWLGIILWICCTCLLAGGYYLGDLLLFPHAARALSRVLDATVTSLLSMVCGTVAEYYSQGRRAKASH